MRRTTILTLASLLIAGCFAFQQIRIAAQEREIARQREQTAVMRKTAIQAREAFDRMQALSSPRFVMAPIGGTIGIIAIGHNFETGKSYGRFIPTRSTPKEEAVKDLDAEIEKLKIVSKEK